MSSESSASEQQPFSPDTRFVAQPELIETDLEDELVLMEPASGKMFGLNVTGRFVWRALPDETLEQIANRLAEHFGISYEEAVQDTSELLDALCNAGLVHKKDDTPPDNATPNTSP